MANGVAVVTEPSAGVEPLRRGVHFVESDDIAGSVAELLDDPERCAAIGDAGATRRARRAPAGRRLAPILDRLDALDVTPSGRRRQRIVRRNKPMRAPKPPLFPVFRPADVLRERVFHALLAEQRLQRTIDVSRCQLVYGAAGHVLEFTTPAYEPNAALPEVSVVVTLFNYADVVTEALESITASHRRRRRDRRRRRPLHRRRARRRAAVHRRPPRRARCCSSAARATAACPQARNLGIARARAAKVMILDADNTVYPTCLRRLADALDADPGASFAYATLEAFGAEPGLRSHLPWHVPWLCAANYLDAQAMIRRDVLERHGGYREDEWIYGWEDWDLWLRLAVAGEHGVHVPEMLGRYRTQDVDDLDHQPRRRRDARPPRRALSDAPLARLTQLGVRRSATPSRPRSSTVLTRSSQPNSTATARGSWRRRWPAPTKRLSSAEPWAAASWRASVVGTLSSSSPCITSSGRGAKRRAASVGRKRRNARLHSSNDAGKPGVADRPDLAGVLEEAARVGGPVVEVGPRAQQRGRTDARIVGADADGDRATGVGADQHDPGRVGLGAHEVDRRCAGRRPIPAARSRRCSCRCRGS